jgi:methionyl-tRNA formyltransferase
MAPYRLLFMGTAPIAAPALRACAAIDGVELLAAVSQPPARRGRGRKLSPSALHQAALELGLEVATPQRFAGDEGDEILDTYRPDACVVMAYGQIIKANHLARCPSRWLNLHGSLLPRWRGAAPIERCLEAGDERTGMQLMQMESGLDTGPVFAELSCSAAGHTSATLNQALAEIAAELLQRDLLRVLQGELKAKPQSAEGACYAHRLERADGQIDFLGSAEVWARKSRAFDPKLGLRCKLTFQQKELGIKIWSADVVAQVEALKPGQILRADRKALWVSCERGVLNLRSLQLDGKKRLNWSELRAGLALSESDLFHT